MIRNAAGPQGVRTLLFTSAWFALFTATGHASDPKPNPSPTQPLPDVFKARAVETKNLSFGYRNRRMFASDRWEDALVGGLVQNPVWSKELLLAPAQANVINKLDALLQEANDQATRNAADYMDTNPSDYREFNTRLNRRLHETLRHAERMVSLGLLTDAQAAFVLQTRISGSGSPLYVLYDKNVQELLGMTANQVKDLAEVGAAANRREARLNLWTVNPKEQELVRSRMAANAKQMNEAALDVLNPNQRELWTLLSAPRSMLKKAPDLTDPTASEAAHIKFAEVSSVFRALSDKSAALELADGQKKLLIRLDEIVRVGLHWNRLKFPKDPAPNSLDRTSQDFVRHAEQVALFGILSEIQAKQLESATK